MAMPDYLFDRWPSLVERIRRARRVRAFFDFDGTLAPIRHEPDSVVVGRTTRRAIDRLAAHAGVRVVVVSGRRREALVRHIGLPRVTYWGMYGWERGPRPRLSHRARRDLSRARASVTEGVSDVTGVRIEDKTFGFSIHARGATDGAAALARERLGRALQPFAARLHVLEGTRVWDVVPARIRGKGEAIRQAVARLREPWLPIYVGDDLTDEPAFDALASGVTVRVGRQRPTSARYWLASPGEVRRFIERLEGVLP